MKRWYEGEPGSWIYVSLCSGQIRFLRSYSGLWWLTFKIWKWWICKQWNLIFQVPFFSLGKVRFFCIFFGVFLATKHHHGRLWSSPSRWKKSNATIKKQAKHIWMIITSSISFFGLDGKVFFWMGPNNHLGRIKQFQTIWVILRDSLCNNALFLHC